MEIYVVQFGDTIYSIADRYNVSPQRVISDNGLLSPENIVPGQALLILIPKTIHTVQRGETLASIAEMYGTDVLALIQNNPYLTLENNLRVGQTIVVEYDMEKRRAIRFNGFVHQNVKDFVLEGVLPYVTYLIIFGYGFNDDATINSLDDERIIELSHKYRAAVLLSLSMINIDGSFVSSRIEPLLTDKEFQNRVISGMIAEITRKNAQGMDIDIEYVPPQYRVEFAEFVDNSARQLNAAGYVLNTDLAPKISADQTGTLYEAHDYALLGKASDMVFLMTYEWGYKFGPPLPTAPIKNVKTVLDYALTEIPQEKIYLGMPNYAYDWELPFIKGETAAEVIGNIAAAELAFVNNVAIEYDEQAQSPFYNYISDNGAEHIVWFEDVRSMNAKYELIYESEIIGGGYWNFMRPFPQGYLLLNSIYDIEKLYP